jgi:hypothetical protein
MKYKDWSDFRIYCSKINSLMAQPQGFTALSKPQLNRYEILLSKTELTENDVKKLAYLKEKLKLYLNPPILSSGAKNFLVEFYSRERYNIKKAASGGIPKSAQIKGSLLEKEGVELISKVNGIQYTKETEPVSDDYFIGVCDIKCELKNMLIDVKTSWNAANFMKSKKNKLPTELWAQMQGYLHLYNIPKGQVCYVLVNTPPHLIEQEWANIFKKYAYGEITREQYDDGCYKLEGFYDYNKIPEKKRIVRFDVDYCPAYITKAKTKVDMARVWLNEFERLFMSGKNIETNPEMYLKYQEPDQADDEDESIMI